MIQIGSLNMPEWLAIILLSAGVIFIICVITVVAVTLKEVIGDYIDRKKYEYKRKHRFDKPPTAKCYCKDCRNFVDREFDNHCSALRGIHVHDNWFCKDAEPRMTDPDGGEEDK